METFIPLPRSAGLNVDRAAPTILDGISLPRARSRFFQAMPSRGKIAQIALATSCRAAPIDKVDRNPLCFCWTHERRRRSRQEERERESRSARSFYLSVSLARYARTRFFHLHVPPRKRRTVYRISIILISSVTGSSGTTLVYRSCAPGRKRRVKL